MKKQIFIKLIIILNFLFVYFPCKYHIIAAENIRPPLLNKKIENENKYLQLEKLVKQIREERETYYKIKNDWDKEKNQMQNELKMLEQEIEFLTHSLKNEKIKSENIKKSIFSLKQDLQGSGLNQELYTPLLWDTVNELNKFVLNDIPYRKNERLEQIEFAKSFLSEKDKSLVEKFARVWEVCNNELGYALNNDIYDDKIEINGVLKVVRILRIGKIGMYYKTNDDKEYGVLVEDGNKGYKWETNLSANEIKGINEAFNITGKRKPAIIINLPVKKFFQ